MTNSLSEKSSMEIGARVKAKGLEKDKLKKYIYIKKKKGKDRKAGRNTFSSTSFVLTRYKGRGRLRNQSVLLLLSQSG